jgi:hypothetical protein
MRASILSGENNGVGVDEDAALSATTRVDNRHADQLRQQLSAGSVPLKSAL